MEIKLTPPAEKDLNHWKKPNNSLILKRIKDLLASILESPFSGIGKPEALKYQLAGKWSRRIDKENRLVYSIERETIYIYSMKGHYL
jgi:toxin YoeB